MDGRYFFEGFCLDEERTRLTDPKGEKVPLKPTAFRVLRLLLQDAPYTVTRKKFFETIWPDDRKSKESALRNRLDKAIGEVRFALGDDADGANFVKLVPREGFAFGADVRKPNIGTAVLRDEPLKAVVGGALVLSTKTNNPQWADYAAYQAPPAPWSLRCQITTSSPYFRFGFKLLGKSSRLFGDGSLQSDDENLLIHIGRNYWDRPGITKRDLFQTAYMNGRRLSLDAKLKRVPTAVKLDIEVTLDREYLARFFVDGELQFSQILPAPFCEQVAVLAWGDQDQFRVDVSELSLKTTKRQ